MHFVANMFDSSQGMCRAMCCEESLSISETMISYFEAEIDDINSTKDTKGSILRIYWRNRHKKLLFYEIYAFFLPFFILGREVGRYVERSLQQHKLSLRENKRRYCEEVIKLRLNYQIFRERKACFILRLCRSRGTRNGVESTISR